MFVKILSYIFNRKNYKSIYNFEKIVKKINYLENIFINYSDNDLKENTNKYRNLLLEKGISLLDILPEAFANVREASRRVLGMRHFDVQLIGGMVLNKGCIAEMKTGEGKTLTSTLSAYLNSLYGLGVHIVTVNEYLAKRDANYNSILFNFLGLSVGLNLSTISLKDKKKSYLADITYATSNEYCFDYLRDNMVSNIEEKVQRKLNYVIIDEVDSILIDEARTPLVISGCLENISDLYIKVNKIISFLKKQDKEDNDDFCGDGDFVLDEKDRQIFLTERGILKVEKLLVQNNIIDNNISLYSSDNIRIFHYVISALKAHYLFVRNVDYLVRNDEIVIVDEHTGRIMPDRRWSDGLHQAIEAKENLNIKSENQTLASITFQNYFRLYKKISGMTGTALTEASEFKSIYNLNTISIPTNKKIIREDYSDLVFLTEKEKINYIIEDIKFRKKKLQPVLVGTISIEKSELISSLLLRSGIEHNVLNAKFHMFEANIISQAGKPGAVTIATNMAGRGTDIILGGNWINEVFLLKNKDSVKVKEIKNFWKKNHDLVVKSGGLHVIGSERHDARRIDNQLRGRSGRQGDPGSSRFYVSMEDSLIRVFATEKIIFFMRRLGIKYGEYIEHTWINKSIEKAQSRIENRNFNIRKELLDYDNIINEQRKIIYMKRDNLLFTKNIKLFFLNLLRDIIDILFIKFSNESNFILKVNLICKCIYKEFGVVLNLSGKEFLNVNDLKEFIFYFLKNLYNDKEKLLGKSILRLLERNILVQVLDLFWREYLYSIEYLRENIYLRGYAQRDPKQEYKKESYRIFFNMLNIFKYEVVKFLFHLPYDLDKIYSYIYSKSNFNKIDLSFLVKKK